MHSTYIGQQLWDLAVPSLVHMRVIRGGVSIVWYYPYPAIHTWLIEKMAFISVTMVGKQDIFCVMSVAEERYLLSLVNNPCLNFQHVTRSLANDIIVVARQEERSH